MSGEGDQDSMEICMGSRGSRDTTQLWSLGQPLCYQKEQLLRLHIWPVAGRRPGQAGTGGSWAGSRAGHSLPGKVQSPVPYLFIHHSCTTHGLGSG